MPFGGTAPDGPRLGHAFTTVEDGLPVSWEVVEETLAYDEEGEPFLDLVAQRDYTELEELPDHELEHTLARREAEVPEAALATVARAQTAGLAVELVALDPGEEPDWRPLGATSTRSFSRRSRTTCSSFAASTLIAIRGRRGLHR